MGLHSLSHTHPTRPSLWNANPPTCMSCNGFPIRKATCVFGGLNGSFSMKLPNLQMQKWRRGVFTINAIAGSDFYNTLGVTRNSSKAEIKTAYRKLARQYHPDVNKEIGAEAKFKDISNAYETLSDEGKRSIYDKYGEAGLRGGGAGGDSFYGDPFDLFESLFDAMGGMDIMSSLDGMDFRSNRRRNAHGPDEQAELHIEFLEAVFGVKKDVEVSRLEICNPCKGSGNKPGTKPKKCKRCNGRGQVTSSTETLFGEFRQIFPCNTCGGIGHSTTPCSICRGEGRVRKKSKVSVPVPAGVESGNRLRVRSEGSIGKRGGPSGDLILSLYVRPDRQLSRDGSNILYTCKISYIDAVRGVSLHVPTVDGKTELRIPAGTQHGATLVMDKKGAPVLGQPNVRADQLVRIQVSIPRHLDSQERELLEQLSKLRDSHPEPLNAR